MGVRLADTQDMMISKEQATAAARHLVTQSHEAVRCRAMAVSDELLEQAAAIVRDTPATDERRIADARLYLQSDRHDSRDVAAMMIQRIVSDALR